MGCRLTEGGAIFPVEVKDGDLKIWVGSRYVSYHSKSFKIDFPKNTIAFPSSTIFAYLRNPSHQMVLRYDGTWSLYLKDNTLVGYGDFDLESIMSRLKYFSAGIYVYPGSGPVDSQDKWVARKTSFIYIEDDEYVLQVLDKNESFIIKPAECPEYMDALVMAYGTDPTITEVNDNLLTEISNKYTIPAEEVKCHGGVSI